MESKTATKHANPWKVHRVTLRLEAYTGCYRAGFANHSFWANTFLCAHVSRAQGLSMSFIFLNSWGKHYFMRCETYMKFTFFIHKWRSLEQGCAHSWVHRSWLVWCYNCELWGYSKDHMPANLKIFILLSFILKAHQSPPTASPKRSTY